VSERILIVEDDEEILNLLERWLMLKGYDVDTARDGIEGTFMGLEQDYDLIILDLMLPKRDGLDVCRIIRNEKTVPIIILTARETIPDRVEGLDAGADDYIVKPFDIEELLARVRVVFRRTQNEEIEIIVFSDLRLDTGTHQVFRGEREIELTAKEFELLELFMRNPRQVLTRALIYDRVWGYDFGGESNIIEVYVRYLRQKIEQTGEFHLIHTVRGVGYVLREQE